LHSIELFKVDIILVMDHERLYSDLNVELKAKRPGTQVVKLKKSGGVTMTRFMLLQGIQHLEENQE